MSDRIPWDDVKRLFIMDMQYEDIPSKWDFVPCVEFHDGRWREIQNTSDIGTARRCCLRLSAIHDKPFRDWTRPAPGPLHAEAFRLRMEGREEEGPFWGAGWENADPVCGRGGTFNDRLNDRAETERALRAGEGHEKTGSAGDLDGYMLMIREEAVTRWLLLEAANPRPEAVA